MEKTLTLLFVLFGAVTVALSAVVFPAEAQIAAANYWTAKSLMPTERIFFGAASANGIVYAMGGIHYQMINGKSTQAPTDVNEAYDPISDNWTTKAPMPTPFTHFGADAYQNKIYCISGTTNSVYDISTNSWQTLSPMPTPRTNLMASIVKGKIYLIGGEQTSANGTATSSILNEVYDITTDTWTSAAPLPIAETGYVSAVVGDKIYIVASSTGVVQAYDPQLDNWTTLASIPVPVSNAASASISVGQNSGEPTIALLVIGGTTQDDPIHAANLTQIYYPGSNSWVAGAPLLYPRAALAAASIDGTVFALGGGQNAFFNPQSSANQQYGPIVQTRYSPSPSPTQTLTPSPTPTLSPSNSPTQQRTLEPSQSLSPSLTPSPTVPELPSWIILLVALIVGALIAVTKIRGNVA